MGGGKRFELRTDLGAGLTSTVGQNGLGIALYAGESCALIHDIKPAARIVADIVAEAERLLDTLHA